MTSSAGPPGAGPDAAAGPASPGQSARLPAGPPARLGRAAARARRPGPPPGMAVWHRLHPLSPFVRSGRHLASFVTLLVVLIFLNSRQARARLHQQPGRRAGRPGRRRHQLGGHPVAGRRRRAAHRNRPDPPAVAAFPAVAGPGHRRGPDRDWRGCSGWPSSGCGWRARIPPAGGLPRLRLSDAEAPAAATAVDGQGASSARRVIRCRRVSRCRASAGARPARSAAPGAGAPAARPSRRTPSRSGCCSGCGRRLAVALALSTPGCIAAVVIAAIALLGLTDPCPAYVAFDPARRDRLRARGLAPVQRRLRDDDRRGRRTGCGCGPGWCRRLRRRSGPGRVQAVRLVEPLVWRALGWCRLEVDVAGPRQRRENRSESRRLRALVPVGSRAEAEQMIGELLVSAARAVQRATAKRPLEGAPARITSWPGAATTVTWWPPAAGSAARRPGSRWRRCRASAGSRVPCSAGLGWPRSGWTSRAAGRPQRPGPRRGRGGRPAAPAARPDPRRSHPGGRTRAPPPAS